MATVVVLSGGPDSVHVTNLPAGATVIAADGGAEQAHELGLAVDLVIGDLDSIEPSTLAALERSGARVDRHSVEKDATDLELALDAALALDPVRIVVVGGGGGRLDHLLGELLLLAADAYAGVRGRRPTRCGRRSRGPGRAETRRACRASWSRSSPSHGPAAGVVTEGLLYPLRGETLAPGSSRGLSNAFVAAEARIAVERGVLLAVRPSGSVSAGS